MQTGDEVAVKLVSHNNVWLSSFTLFAWLRICVLCRNLRVPGILNFIMSQSSICFFKEEVSFFLSLLEYSLFGVFCSLYLHLFSLKLVFLIWNGTGSRVNTTAWWLIFWALAWRICLIIAVGGLILRLFLCSQIRWYE